MAQHGTSHRNAVPPWSSCGACGSTGRLVGRRIASRGCIRFERGKLLTVSGGATKVNYLK